MRKPRREEKTGVTFPKGHPVRSGEQEDAAVPQDAKGLTQEVIRLADMLDNLITHAHVEDPSPEGKPPDVSQNKGKFRVVLAGPEFAKLQHVGGDVNAHTIGTSKRESDSGSGCSTAYVQHARARQREDFSNEGDVKSMDVLHPRQMFLDPPIG